MEEDILALVSRVASEAQRSGDAREIEQLITFFKARLIADFGGIVATTIASKLAIRDSTGERMSAGAATVIEETARCFELIARREWGTHEEGAR